MLREKLLDRIRLEHKSKFDNPNESETSRLSSLMSFLPGSLGNWKATDGGRWLLAATEFVKLEGKREYHRKSGLTFARYYSKTEEMLAGLGTTAKPMERILLLPFKVLWKANVKADGRFHDTAVVNIVLEDNAFREPTEQESARYNVKKEES